MYPNITANFAEELGRTPRCSTPLQICCKPEHAGVAARPGGTAGLTDPGTHPAGLTHVLRFETQSPKPKQLGAGQELS